MKKLGTPRSSKGLAVFCSRIAENKLAQDIIIMDLRKIESAPADFFVVCSGDSDNQIRAITNDIMKKCSEKTLKKPRIEGLDTANWVLLDFFDVVVHIMLKQTRNYYKLEKLWGDSVFIRLNEKAEPRAYNKKNLKNIYTEI